MGFSGKINLSVRIKAGLIVGKSKSLKPVDHCKGQMPALFGDFYALFHIFWRVKFRLGNFSPSVRRELLCDTMWLLISSQLYETDQFLCIKS